MGFISTYSDLFILLILIFSWCYLSLCTSFLCTSFTFLFFFPCCPPSCKFYFHYKIFFMIIRYLISLQIILLRMGYIVLKICPPKYIVSFQYVFSNIYFSWLIVLAKHFKMCSGALKLYFTIAVAWITLYFMKLCLSMCIVYIGWGMSLMAVGTTGSYFKTPLYSKMERRGTTEVKLIKPGE